MAKYKDYDYSQGKFIPINFDKQILHSTFEHTLHCLIVEVTMLKSIFQLKIVLLVMLFISSCHDIGGDHNTTDLNLQLTWSKQLGAVNSFTTANSVIADLRGNIYMVGDTYGGLDGKTLIGTEDCFLAMYDSSGNKVRTKQLGVAGSATLASSVAVDSSGNVYVAGRTYGGLDGNTLAGDWDLFVTMYDSSGNKVRTKQLGVTGRPTEAAGVAVDSSGNVYVAGTIYGGLIGNTFVSTSYMFLAMYDSYGNKVRTNQLGVEGEETSASGVAVDSNGNVYVVGTTYGGLDGNTLEGTADFFLTMYDAAGNKVRTNQLGVTGIETSASSVAVDSNDNVYVVGYTHGGLDGNTLMGACDYFVTQYNSSGKRVRTYQRGVVKKAAEANSVATDFNGNVYVVGWTNGVLDDSDDIYLSGAFLTKYASTGN